MDSLVSGNFNTSSWGSGLMSSACGHSCSDKQHYHRHCSCALHYVESGFVASSSCSRSRTVKVSASASRNGIVRSLSVNNFGDSWSSSLSPDEAVSKFDFSPSSELDWASDDIAPMEREQLPSVETVTLVEELANFINLINCHQDASAISDVEEDTADDISWDDEVVSSSCDSCNGAFENSTSDSDEIPTASTSFLTGSSDKQLANFIPAVHSPVEFLLSPLRVPLSRRPSSVLIQGTSRFGRHRKVKSFCC